MNGKKEEIEHALHQFASGDLAEGRPVPKVIRPLKSDHRRFRNTISRLRSSSRTPIRCNRPNWFRHVQHESAHHTRLPAGSEEDAITHTSPALVRWFT